MNTNHSSTISILLGEGQGVWDVALSEQKFIYRKLCQAPTMSAARCYLILTFSPENNSIEFNNFVCNLRLLTSVIEATNDRPVNVESP